MAVLEGRTVRLRPIVPSDHPELLRWYRDPELVAPFDRFFQDTDEEFVRSLETAEGDRNSLAPRWAIERRTEGDLVGVVGYYAPHPVLGTVDVWYLVGRPEARGRGVGVEAVGLLVDHLFQTEAVARVGATCDVENAASYRLLEKLGFRREGTLRSALFHHGCWHDVYVYGITKEERSSPPRPA